MILNPKELGIHMPIKLAVSGKFKPQKVFVIANLKPSENSDFFRCNFCLKFGVFHRKHDLLRHNPIFAVKTTHICDEITLRR